MAFGDFTVTRASTKNVLGSAGTYVSVANNTPAFEFNTDGTYRGLLVEPGATNLALRSQEFGTTWVTGNASVTDNQTVAPDGATTADLVVDNATSNIHRLRQTITLSGSTTYTLSVFAKKNTLSNFQLALISTTDSSTASAVFNLDNGTVGESIVLTATLASTSIQNVGNGWYRCSITGSMATTPNTAQITLATLSTGNATSAGQVTYSGSGTGSIFIWQAQLETGSVATSPIVTTGSTASRVADNNQLTSASSLIGQTEGFVYAEIDISRTGVNGQVAEIWEDDDNRISIQINATGNIVLVSRAVASTTVNAVSASAYTSGMLKLALRYKLNDYALYANGSSIITDTSSTVPATSKISLGVSRAGGTHLNRHLRAFVTGATALDNSTLASLTTL